MDSNLELNWYEKLEHCVASYILGVNILPRRKTTSYSNKVHEYNYAYSNYTQTIMVISSQVISMRSTFPSAAAATASSPRTEGICIIIASEDAAEASLSSKSSASSQLGLF